MSQISLAKENSHNQPLTTQQPPRKGSTALTMCQIIPAKENSHNQPHNHLTTTSSPHNHPKRLKLLTCYAALCFATLASLCLLRSQAHSLCSWDSKIHLEKVEEYLWLFETCREFQFSIFPRNDALSWMKCF